MTTDQLQSVYYMLCFAEMFGSATLFLHKGSGLHDYCT